MADAGAGAAPPHAAGLRLEFPPGLPISARAKDIQEAIAAHPVVIVAGATGSGKTTQLPKMALAMGRGRERRIGVTQPRRIAATSVAARVASELGCELGREVGFQIRFEDRGSPATRLKFMTDGILLAEIQSDRLLRAYDTLILDEVHERSLNIDFLLGWLQRILPQRPDLKLVVSSATLETERLSKYFAGAPIIDVEGRTFPVDVLYEPPDPEIDVSEAVAQAVENVVSLDPEGDILAFLPGEREIREAERALAARELRFVVVQPLYSRLSAADQSKVFGRVSGRRVILATNVAETSLTLPGIVYVIDTGVARLARYDPRTGTTRLLIEPISRASADQRKGRSGRVREGICIRLYEEASFLSRPEYTDPEIKRTSLAAVILRMKALGLGEVEEFPFLDAPHPRAVREGYRVLEELGAIDEARELTPLGRRLSRFPVDPRIARMILMGAELGCLSQVVVLSAALELQDPRERPREGEQRADALHRRFHNERSDFSSLLSLWDFVSQAAAQGTGKLKRACKENYLSFVRVREWLELARRLEEVVAEVERGGRGRRGRGRGRPRGEAPDAGSAKAGNAQAGSAKAGNAQAGTAPGELDQAIHRALASGLLSRIGQYRPEQRVYAGARQTRFVIHPSSGLAKKPPAWIMAFELVETSQLFARTVAKIEPEWLIDVAGHLLERRVSDPYWSKKSARAQVREHATLYGLMLYRDRPVDYASIAPVRARLMFLEHALVRGEYESRGRFQADNRALLEEVSRLRDKARKSDMLRDDDTLLAFFDARVPATITNGKSFEAWRQKAELENPDLLRLSLEDVLAQDEQLSARDYPDTLAFRGLELELRYRFDPAAEDDGVTVRLPLAILGDVEPAELDWVIPAWQRERILSLLALLPRARQQKLGPLPELCERVSARLSPFEEPFVPALLRAIAELSGEKLSPAALRLDALPPHLRPHFEILDEAGKVLDRGRDLPALLERYRALAARAHQSAGVDAAFQKGGLTSFSFGNLPEYVTRRVLGHDVRVYPALVDRESSVELTLFESKARAEAATRAGLSRLIRLAAKRPLIALEKRIPRPFTPLDRRVGMPFSPSEVARFRELVLDRVVREAYTLPERAALPRTKAEFDRLLAYGTPRLESICSELVRHLEAARVELDETLRALEKAASQPSGTWAAKDIKAQLELLFPPGVASQLPLEVLARYPCYLRAARVRLSRAVIDPRKDADKLAPFAPVWKAFLEKAKGDGGDEAARLRWAFEELRVAIFAPELKPAQPATVAQLALRVERLP